MRWCGAKTRLDSLLQDDLIQAMMKADDVDPESIRLMVKVVSQRRAAADLETPINLPSVFSRAWRLYR